MCFLSAFMNAFIGSDRVAAGSPTDLIVPTITIFIINTDIH